MGRLSLCLLILLLGAGCRAPMPKFKPLAAYGPTRVPPPATGSFGTGNAYYQPTSTVPLSTTPLSTTPIGTGLNGHSTSSEPYRAQPVLESPGGANHTAQLTSPVPNAVAGGFGSSAVTGSPAGSSTTSMVPMATVVAPNSSARVALTPPPLGGPNSFAASLRGMPVSDLTAQGLAATAAANGAASGSMANPATVTPVPNMSAPVGTQLMPMPMGSGGVIDIGQLPNASSAVLRTSPPTTLASNTGQSLTTFASSPATASNAVLTMPSAAATSTGSGSSPSSLQAAGWQMR